MKKNIIIIGIKIVIVLSVIWLSFDVILAKAESDTDPYVLIDSELSTTEENEIKKTDWQSSTNCYYYSINRFNRLYDDQYHPIYNHNPGFIAYGNIIEIDTMENLLNNVESDLEALHCENITISTTKPTYINGYHLICVRIGEDVKGKDYHFMKYNPVDGFWYHKPGTSGMVLRYKYNPTNEKEWTNEFVGLGRVPQPPTITYDSEIYYIMYKPTLKTDTRNGGYAIGSYEDFGYIEQFGIRDKEKGNTWSLTNSFSIPNNVNWTPITDTENLTISGNGNTISGLRISMTTQSAAMGNVHLGFLMVAKNNTTIRDLTFNNVEIHITGDVIFDDMLNIGVVAAVNFGNIINCTVGNIRIYGEANITSNLKANIGGICGINRGHIGECSVNYFHAAGFGNIGGVTGQNYDRIYNSNVTASTIGLYHGTAGGMAGYNSGEIGRCPLEEEEEKEIYTDCEVNGVTISCYNGYPDALPQYYTSEHNAMIGGICGWNDRGKINNSTVKYSDIMYNGGRTDSRTFAPEIGLISGRSSTANAINDCTYTESDVSKGNLQTVTWKGGFLNLQTYTWDQAQYVGNRDAGRTL